MMKRRNRKKAPAKKQAAAPKVDIKAMKYESASTWASEVNAAYQQYLDTGKARVQAIIETGKKLIAAKKALNDREWFVAFDAEKVEKPIPISTSYAERFMAIADHPVLKNPDNCLFLPATVSGLYALWQLDKKSPGIVAKALAEHRLNAEMTVREIEALLPQERPKDTPSATSVARRPKKLSEAEKKAAERLDYLERKCERLDLDPAPHNSSPVSIAPRVVCRPCDITYATRSDWWDVQEEINDWIRSHVRECHPDRLISHAGPSTGGKIEHIAVSNLVLTYVLELKAESPAAVADTPAAA